MDEMRYIIGIDEVGRGPLAGPIVVAAALIPAGWRPRRSGERTDLRDSKALTASQRESWNSYLISHPKVRVRMVEVRARKIDEVNIARAANMAARKACERLLFETGIDPSSCTVYLDGGLYISRSAGPRKRALVQTEEAFFAGRSVLSQTVVKGDEIVPAIRIASICAKVRRDSLMVKLAKKYPGYGFERHKGYGTKAHYAALKKLGISKLHRLTFVP